jgi:phage major head subunit gpT-like protein
MTSTGGVTVFEEKTPGSEPATQTPIQQFQQDFVHVPYGVQIPAEREFLDDEDWGYFADIGRQLGYMAGYSMEVLAASLWNDAFTGVTFTAEDNLSLCNSAHLNVDGGNSQDNSFTNSLGFAGLETTRVAMRKFTNYIGDKISVRPRLLVVPTDLEQTGFEILRSQLKPDTTNNNINYYQGMLDMVVWDFLTDTNAWFLCDPRMMKQNLFWYQRIALELFGTGNLFAGTRKIGAYFRASLGVRDWRWIAGNNPS